MDLSHTKLTCARSCWKKFKFRYIDRLIPLKDNISVILGKVIHLASDMTFKGISQDDVYSNIIRIFDEEMSKREMIDQEELEIAKYTALGMWMATPLKSNEDYQEHYSEEERIIPLCGTKFKFRVDGRVKFNNNFWYRELKVTSLSQGDFQKRTTTTTQATNYILASTKTKNPVSGIIYEFYKRPLLRKGANENAQQFGQRIIKDYKIRPDFYFNRFFAYRNAEELSLFEEDLDSFVRDMKRRIKKNDFPRNQDQCWLYNNLCPYSHICFCREPDSLMLQLYYVKGGENNVREEFSL